MRPLFTWTLRFVLPPLILFAVVVAVWDAVVAFWDIKPYFLPRPGQVAQAAWQHAGELLAATQLTAAGALCGFSLSLSLGTFVALVFSQSRVVQRSIYPYAIFFQTVPIVAIAPLVINWFGTGFVSVVVVSFVISVFPIITSTTAGLTAVDANLLELFQMHNASRWQTLLKLRMPNAVPSLVTGAKISCGMAVIGAIVGEFFAGFGTNSKGLGYLIPQTSGQMKIDYMFAAVCCSALLGITIFGAVSLIGATILSRWHIAAPRRQALSKQ